MARLFFEEVLRLPQYLQLYGNVFAGTLGPIFMGLARRYVVSGCGIAKHFEAYVINYRNMDLEAIYLEVNGNPYRPMRGRTIRHTAMST